MLRHCCRKLLSFPTRRSSDLEGPGLTMTVRDPDDAVRVADVLDAIEELRGAGAETMQIDGVRVGVSTAVTGTPGNRSEEHTSELQSHVNLVCRLLLEKKNQRG